MKRISKFTILLLVSSLVIIVFFACVTAQEQTYPTKPIKIVVGYNPGGNDDLSIRILAKYAKEYFGQPFVVTNIVGAGGSVASQEVRNSKPDGYTLSWWQDSMHVAYHAGISDFTWDSFIPVCEAVTGVDMLVVLKDSPFNTINELMDYAKKNPGELTLAANVGSTSQFLGIEINLALGNNNNFIFVSAGGDSSRLDKLLGGFLDVIPLTPAAAKGFIDSGQVKALAVTGQRRHHFFPDIPTFVESGYNVITDEKNLGLFAPPGVPKEIIDFISENMRKLTEDKRVMRDLNNAGFMPLYRDHNEFCKKLLEVDTMYYKLSRAAGLLKREEK